MIRNLSRCLNTALIHGPRSGNKSLFDYDVHTGCPAPCARPWTYCHQSRAFRLSNRTKGHLQYMAHCLAEHFTNVSAKGGPRVTRSPCKTRYKSAARHVKSLKFAALSNRKSFLSFAVAESVAAGSGLAACTALLARAQQAGRR